MTMIIIPLIPQTSGRVIQLGQQLKVMTTYCVAEQLSTMALKNLELLIGQVVLLTGQRVESIVPVIFHE